MTTHETVRPTDLRSVRDAVLDTAGPIGIAGSGTALGWAGALGPVDTVLDTTGLTGVIAHNPGDMTVSVHAGTPLRALAEEVGAHGQHVAFDAARVADGATVGGLVATADAGPSALVHGSLRDLVIGTTLVLADGTVAHSGGHVIKNVAGYDLTKLVHGSYGTLAVIVEVVLRLHPVPQRSATVTLACSLADAAEHAARVLAGPHEPVALEWISEDGGQLLVRIEGTEDALGARAKRLGEVLGAGARIESDGRRARREGSDESAVRPKGSESAAPTGSDESAARPTGSESAAPTGSDESAARREGSDESAARSGGVWGRHATLVRGGPAQAVLRIGARPSVLPGLLAALSTSSVTAGLGTGVATVALDLDAVDAAHAAVHAAGGTSVLRSRPAGSSVPVWGPPPSALRVLQAVKTELDPQGRFGPGRFDPWM